MAPLAHAVPCLALLLLQLGQTAADEENPISKVTELLQEMKAQVEKEYKEDEEAHAKYTCWCGSNQGEKTEAVAAAQARVQELETFIEEAASRQGELKTHIGELQQQIAEDQEALQVATKLKEEETSEFEAQAKETKDVIATLDDAVNVLSKVQLLQGGGRKGGLKAKPVLLQLEGVVNAAMLQRQYLSAGRPGQVARFRDALQKDLWDVAASLDNVAVTYGGDRKLAAVERSTILRTQQVPVSEEQAGQAAKPNDEQGAASGASSYSGRSGAIFGILRQMKEEFEKDLSTAQKEELQSLISFQRLRGAKTGSIHAAGELQGRKEDALVALQAKAASAKEEVVATKDALSADQQFLLELEETCKSSVADYEERHKMRGEELTALAEVIKVLSEEDSRALFHRTLSFVQTRLVSRHTQRLQEQESAQRRASRAAASRISRAAAEHKDLALASLALRVGLDSFTKVIEAIDKMMAELKQQQKDESARFESCRLEIDRHEDDVKVGEQEKEDLEEKKLGLENTIAQLKAEMEELSQVVSESEQSLKQAGEDRKAENLLFQESVSDARATVQVLKKAQARMAQFYAKTGALAQVAAARQEPSKPGQANAPEPEQKTYEKSAGAGGVMQLLAMVTGEAERSEAKLMTSEQHAQSDYESLVKALHAGVEANREAIMEKTALSTHGSADLSETKGDLLSKGEELQTLGGTLSGLHLECDWLVKYHETRQKARSEEIGAIVEARAILKGADFGKAQEEADEATA